MLTEELDYELPAELIAQRPAVRRSASRLLVIEADSGSPAQIDLFVDSFLHQLRDDDLLVVNDTRVLHARLALRRSTGGEGELLLLHPLDDEPTQHSWVCLAKPARRYRPGTQVATASGGAVSFVERRSDGTWIVELPVQASEAEEWLLHHGQLPLPPYIAPPLDSETATDSERYQTTYATRAGSVAAPTAGLHFDDELWAAVTRRVETVAVTLHVGAGTFLPVRTDALHEHVMHTERYEVPDAADRSIHAALADGRRVVAVGTTTTRVLESVYGPAALPRRGTTDLFITPGYEFRCVGALLTNFHLPRSTLLALTMAFAGADIVRDSYRHAIANRMRFYSFGDAMFVHGRPVRA